jgi:diphthamide synthase (EF-2-diphthine--ammonia ligase)
VKYIASCSFGKDSLAAIIECERWGLHIDKVILTGGLLKKKDS